ncbi:(2Fe-2S) ferredoxin [Nocardioides scoriae]|uniref:(2Fe-2S) ferredoxin n=1 Tax=Nocardioides scoriae TaxID=642780 RepID=A0A1H1P4K1_9ACTN|nr:(2Fe-2S) ferredoxin domain-containing protein [Nocardioides scoriae]SDS06171.1 (2Fe-2S) ferredoxin [Nocardioides scoriae]
MTPDDDRPEVVRRVVLVGMSVREVDARDRLREAAERLPASYAGSVAFLQLGDPSLARCLTGLADELADARAGEGADEVVLLGVSLGTFAPGASWLRRIAAHWWRERTGHRPVVRVGTSLLGAEDLVARDHEGDDRLAEAVESARVVDGREPGMTSEAWEQVTRHRHQVLVCRGPRCTALASDSSAEALVLALMGHDLGDDDVLVTHTGCQLPCNQAPVVSVQPDDVWYGHVDPDAAREIVARHLVGGVPVETHRLDRARRDLG